jgi:hypothetical protein
MLDQLLTLKSFLVRERLEFGGEVGAEDVEVAYRGEAVAELFEFGAELVDPFGLEHRLGRL